MRKGGGDVRSCTALSTALWPVVDKLTKPRELPRLVAEKPVPSLFVLLVAVKPVTILDELSCSREGFCTGGYELNEVVKQ